MEFGKGRPVILLHSLGGSGRDWIYQIQELVKFGFRVIVPDMAGHGASEKKISTEITLNELVKDVWAILDALNEFKVSIVGLSPRGLISMKAARQLT